jgi:hypothetical protein
VNQRQHLLIRAGAVLLIALVVIGLPGPIPASAAPASILFRGIAPRADSYLTSTNPNANYGTLTGLRADASPMASSYLRFTVQRLGALHITKAHLRMYVNNGSSGGLTAKAVPANSWGERTIDYRNRPAMGRSLGSSGAVSSDRWVVLNVTSYVTAAGTYSFGVTTSGSSAISFASRESGAHAPRLILTLSGSTTASPSGSIQHVFVVVMENHSYTQVWNTSSPTIASLHLHATSALRAWRIICRPKD